MRRKISLLLSLLIALSGMNARADASHAMTRRLPIGLAPPADEGSWDATISADGRFVTFVSRATNLVPGDTNGKEDVFVVDLTTRAIERVAVSSGGAQADGWSHHPALSGDGRYVVFSSAASNLVAGDTNVVCDYDYNGRPDNCPDIFLRDRVAGTTERVSLSSNGEQGNGWSVEPSISTDGQVLAFTSAASNLIPGDTNGWWDTFVLDRSTEAIERVSVSASGLEGNLSSGETALSGEGRYVGFSSSSTNLVAGDTNARSDVFIRDRWTDTVQRISVAASGEEFTVDSEFPDISDDGRWVVFVGGRAEPRDLGSGLQVWARDRANGEMVLVTRTWTRTGSSGGSLGILEIPKISPGGRWVLYSTFGDDLVPGDTNGTRDTFVFDLVSRRNVAVSVNDQGDFGNSVSADGDISGDGRLVTFQSFATNLDPEPAPFHSYIILRDRGAPTCFDDTREEGKVSSRLNHAEEPAGPAGPVIHEASCAAAAHSL